MSTPHITLEALALKVETLELIVENKFPKTLMAHRTNIVEIVQQIVCEEFEISRNILLGEKRLYGYVWPRHVAMALSYEFSSLGTKRLAPLFNRLDHSTILHGCRRVREEEVMHTKKGAQVKKLRQRIVAAITVQPLKPLKT